MLLKKIFSDSLVYTIGPQIPKIASVFILPFITPYLTAADYGIAGIVLAYSGLLNAVSDLGFSVLMMNSFYNYKNKWRHYWGQYHLYLSVWSIVYSALLALLLYYIIPKDAVQNRWPIIFCFVIPSVFFNVTTVIATRFYQYASKPMYISSVSAFVGILSILINLITIKYLKLGYMGWFISSCIGSFIAFLFYIYPVYFRYRIFPIPKFRKRFISQCLKISLPVIPHNYSAFLLNTSDRVVMERLNLGTDQIGKYNVAYTFGSYLEFFGNAVGMAIGPIYTSMFSSKSQECSRDVRFLTDFLQIIFIVISFILSLWCKEFFFLLIKNNELNKVYPIAIVIIMGYAYRPYYWTAITRLQYSEKTKDLWKITFIAGVLNVVLNLIFLPIFGVMAAAVSTFVCLLYMGFAGYFLKSFRKIETERYSPFLFISVILLSSFLVYFLRDLNVTYKLGITLFILIGMSFQVSRNWQRLVNIKKE